MCSFKSLQYGFFCCMTVKKYFCFSKEFFHFKLLTKLSREWGKKSLGKTQSFLLFMNPSLSYIEITAFFPKLVKNLENRKCFKKLALANAILTFDRGVLWFSSSFDLSFTVVPLKVVIGLGKFDFLSL